MFFPCPTSPSRPGKGLDHDDPDMGAWQGTSLGEESASANDEKEDKQWEPKTFFKRLEEAMWEQGEERRRG